MDAQSSASIFYNSLYLEIKIWMKDEGIRMKANS